MAEPCVHRVVTDWADQQPDRVALVADELSLSYRQLDHRANHLAASLIAGGVRRGDLIGLLLPRSANFVIATLAVLKTGAAYLPLDPRYPAERLQMMVTASGCRLVLSTAEFGHRIPHGVTAKWLDEPVTLSESADDPQVPVHPDDIAYTVFTSGSTGVPKAVMIPHRGIVGLLHGDGLAPMRKDDIVLHHHSVSFDATAFEIWTTLLNGARLIVATQTTPSTLDLAALIHQHDITMALLPAGMFHVMVDEQLADLRRLRYIMAGGDVLSSTHARRFTDQAPDVQLVNAYGPTETTFASTFHVVTPDQDPGIPVPIGGPVRQARLYVLDEQLREVPRGEGGELYIGGPGGLARGYLGDAALTAQRFIPDPWIPGGRMYATGDLVRRRPDGTLDFLGRTDSQIKRRGYRIGLGEVELAVRADPAVRNAIVVLEGRSTDDHRLVACVVGQPDADLAGLRTRLAEVLPEYLLPDLILPVEHLPVTVNGKVDRTALVSMIDNTEAATAASAVMTNDEEAVLAAIWTEVLGVERAGRDDDFFDLGGHSLVANKIIAQVHRQLGVKLNLDAIFNHPTIAELAAEVQQARLASNVS